MESNFENSLEEKEEDEVLSDVSNDSDPDISDEEIPLPLVAQPPNFVPVEVAHIKISSTPAFQCLDSLFQNGKITGTRVADLKAKYTRMHEALKSSQEAETKILQEAKEQASILEKHKLDLDRADQLFDGADESEAGRLRKEILRQYNELQILEERSYQNEFKINLLKEESRLVQREYERMPKKGEIENKLKALTLVHDELRTEIEKKKNDSENTAEEIRKCSRENSNYKKEMKEQVEEIENLKFDLVKIQAVPPQIQKECDKCLRKINDVTENLKTIEKELSDLHKENINMGKFRRKLEEEKSHYKVEVAKLTRREEANAREYAEIVKAMRTTEEKKAADLSDKTALEISMRNIMDAKKKEHETFSLKQREKDRDLRSLKKAEMQRKIAEDGLKHYENIYEKVKGTLDSQPKNENYAQKRRDELLRDVDNIKRYLGQERSLEDVESKKVEQSLAQEERLLYEQSDLRVEVIELTRLATIKADEREQKARDFMRAESRYHRAVEDLKTKDLQIQDHKKKSQENELRLKESAKRYDAIKNERNKCVSLIQSSAQKAAELREKMKILQNETEILRTTAFEKENELKLLRLKCTNALVVRDALRNEVARQQRVEEEMKEKREQQRMASNKLNMMISEIEEAMMQLRKQYEEDVQKRNDRGVQLIERNEEVCIFYEKVNIQDSMIRKGNMELAGREEEIRFLRMQLNEEKRNLALLRRRIPDRRNAENELTTLQIQVAQCQDRTKELEKQIEDPQDKSRIRFLEGKDLTPIETHHKIAELESRLSEKEEQILEKRLILDQLSNLIERQNRKDDAGKDDTLCLAKKVNDVQAKMKKATRKMMALISEISLTQSKALLLAKEVEEKKTEIDLCYTRMENNLPPSQSIEEEWNRSIRDERMHKENVEKRLLQEESSDTYKLPDGSYTTAEPRPNAYIPQEGTDLPVARPYGAHAPFTPSVPGASMRHIRKPVPKPIEI